ncbi:hypothetical protein JTE90_026822 [Oedothorax gibbosus]|uniref:Uncharacterized protein n=1 Tax=Oedothorax gibbosus TaxID=931172 RepID=A0AAV6V5A4_9ARAC|nr:hypothetical protein JTE90_026822 [Oedothorax gibbosus]
MPQGEDTILKCNQQKFEQRVPFVIYADLETLVEKLDSIDGPTTKTASHKPCGYSYIVTDGKPHKEPVVHKGDGGVVAHFLASVIAEKDELALKLKDVVPMKITPFDEMIIRNATRCGICKKVLGSDRVRDHNHLTGLEFNLRRGFDFQLVMEPQERLFFRLEMVK